MSFCKGQQHLRDFSCDNGQGKKFCLDCAVLWHCRLIDRGDSLSPVWLRHGRDCRKVVADPDRGQAPGYCAKTYLHIAPTETPSPVLATATLEPSATPAPVLTATTATSYRYLPVGPAEPDLSQPCPGCPRAPGYITGRVFDAAGNPLGGVRLVCYNSWHRYPVVGSKGGGEYDFPILQAEATWYVVVLDEKDQPLSPEAPVFFNPLEACWYRLDWQRVD